VELKKALEKDPKYAAAWANLAVVCERLELDQEAIQANEQVVALGKAKAGNYFRLGLLYAKGNQPDPRLPTSPRPSSWNRKSTARS